MIRTSSPTPAAATRRGVSRRAVVHAGAWSVPVLSLAAIAPSFAASSCPAGALGIIADRFTGVRDYTASTGGGRVVVTSLRVRNNGPDALPQGVLTYTVTIPEDWGAFTGWAGSTPPPPGWTIGGYGTSTVTLTPTSIAKALAVGEEFDLTDSSVAGGRTLVFTTARRYNGEANAATTGVVEATVSTTQTVPNAFTPDSSSGDVFGGAWSGS